MYVELLRRVLDGEEHLRWSTAPENELLLELQRRRARLAREADAGRDGPFEPGARIGDYLRYDLMLIELCRRRGINERLCDRTAGPCERERVESELGAAGLVDWAPQRRRRTTLGAQPST